MEDRGNSRGRMMRSRDQVETFGVFVDLNGVPQRSVNFIPPPEVSCKWIFSCGEVVIFSAGDGGGSGREDARPDCPSRHGGPQPPARTRHEAGATRRTRVQDQDLPEAGVGGPGRNVGVCS